MSASFEWAGMTVGQLAALAMDDLRTADRLAVDRDAGSRMYLFRHGRLEIERMARQVVEPQPAGFAPLGCIPLLIATGGVEIIGLGFAGVRQNGASEEAQFLHVFATGHHESWEATLHTRPDGTRRMDRWAPGSPHTLSERTVRAIKGALAG